MLSLLVAAPCMGCEQATLLWRVFSSSSILRVWVEAKEAKALNNTIFLPMTVFNISKEHKSLQCP